MLQRENVLHSLKRLSGLRMVRVSKPSAEEISIVASPKSLIILAQLSKESELEERSMLLKLTDALKKQNFDAILHANTSGRFEVGSHYKNSSVLLIGISQTSAPDWFSGRILEGPSAKELLNSPQKKKDLWSKILSRE